MNQKLTITNPMKLAAAVICLLYIGVQSFQWWVFSLAPPGNTPGSDFLFGGDPKSIARSWLMLISMFGLFYVHYVVTFSSSEHNRSAQILAFMAFFTFFLLEVILRSVELFYIQIRLTADYLQGSNEVRVQILSFVDQFKKIQIALYFPLGVCWMLGSFIVANLYPLKPVAHCLIKLACYFNGVRVLMRTITVYMDINLFPDAVYNTLYLPMVFIVFGLTASWLFVQLKSQHQT